MRRKAFLPLMSVLLAWASFTVPSRGQTLPSPPKEGLSLSQLHSLVNALSVVSGGIESIQLLRDEDFQINRAAILTTDERGWQIFVFRLGRTGKFALEWKSGRLDDSFAVSSADQFQTYRLSGEQVLKFSGCAAHNCPGVFSVMLYVPSKGTALVATSILGKLSYAPPSVVEPQSGYYKTELDRLLSDAGEPCHSMCRCQKPNLAM